MTINHHLNNDTLLAYSAGTIHEGFALVIQAHLHYCQQCRHQLELANELGGKLLDHHDSVVVSDRGFDDLWQKIQSSNASDWLQSYPSRAENDYLAMIVDKNYHNIPWSFMVPGIEQYIFKDIQCHRGTVRLLKIKSGVRVPHHTHCGTELTLILQGSYEDENGEFCGGDIADLDDSNCHQPHVNSTEDCICLIATEDKLVFSNRFNKLIQPFLGL